MSSTKYPLPDTAEFRSFAPARNQNPHQLYGVVKRVVDIVVASCALLVTWPLILLGALAVKLTSPGPVFYRAQRAGLYGKPFTMFKLRTMYVGTDTPDRKITAAEDDRLTSAGRVLRKFKIDELPQFWNVLLGDMSIIGPRPEEWDLVDRYYRYEDWHMLDTRPGLAGIVEATWYPELTYHDPVPTNSNISMQEWYLRRHLPIMIAQGIRYVEEKSLLLDLKLAVRLFFCVFVYSWWPPKKRPLPILGKVWGKGYSRPTDLLPEFLGFGERGKVVDFTQVSTFQSTEELNSLQVETTPIRQKA